MKKPIIYFVTTNDFKFKSFKQAVELGAYNVQQRSVETPEIQAGDNQSVAKFSAAWAAETYKKPVITEDVGLYIGALKDFPGPFLSQVEKQLGSSGLLALLKGKQRQAYWEYAVAYCEPGQKPVSFRAIQKGSLALKEQGTTGWPAGKLFIQEGQTETISVLLEKGTYVRNNEHYAQLREHLLSLPLL